MVSIKTKEEIALIKESGHITYLTHQYLKSLIKQYKLKDKFY